MMSPPHVSGLLSKGPVSEVEAAIRRGGVSVRYGEERYSRCRPESGTEAEAET